MKKMTNDEAPMTNETERRTGVGFRRLASLPFISSLPSASSFSVPSAYSSRGFAPRRAERAFSLIEVLIAMFVFLVGVLGVLSIFPVAMSSAGRSTGEVRSTILAQDVVAQMNADSQAAYERGVCVDNGGNVFQLKRQVAGADRSGQFVTLTSGLGKWQSRLICQDSGTIMQVVPNWDSTGGWSAPVAGDTYVVTRIGLPLPPATPFGLRSGYVRDIGGDTIYAGKANVSSPSNPQVDALAVGNCAPTPAALGDTVANGGGTDHIKGFSVTWGVDVFRGKLLLITKDSDQYGPAVGQVRWITSNSTDTLQIYPSLALQPDWTKDVRFEIHDTFGYFLVITSGRASGRVFPITGYSSDAANGDHITCGGVSFSSLNVKGARRGTTYPLSGADSFAIIGGSSTLLTAFPVIQIVGVPGLNDDWRNYVFNSFGRPNIAERQKRGPGQVGGDVYKRNNLEKEASDFGVVAILSPEDRLDLSSADKRNEAPVRADVFIFRNYDSAKFPQDNQRALGYMTGYIGRPKP